MERDTKGKKKKKRSGHAIVIAQIVMYFLSISLTARHLYAFKTPCGVDACRFSVRGFLRHVDEDEARRLASNYTGTSVTERRERNRELETATIDPRILRGVVAQTHQGTFSAWHHVSSRRGSCLVSFLFCCLLFADAGLRWQ
jgi:hypothetical protein